MDIINENELLADFEAQRIVPQVGIYMFFNPQAPLRRTHDNHVCQNFNNSQRRQIECLYDVFMDIVSF